MTDPAADGPYRDELTPEEADELGPDDPNIASNAEDGDDAEQLMGAVIGDDEPGTAFLDAATAAGAPDVDGEPDEEAAAG